MSSKTWLWVSAVVLSLGAGGAAIVLSASTHTTSTDLPVVASSSSTATAGASSIKFTMRGAFILFIAPGSVPLTPGVACKGTGTYSDAEEGTPVRVFDAQGNLLATGNLDEGKFVSNPVGTVCTFPLTVPNVPDGPLQYSVEIGQHGGELVSSPTAHSWVSLHVGP